MERGGNFPVTVTAVQRQSGLDGTTFATSFAQMKAIAEKNHGKVFDQDGDYVRLWAPAEPLVRELFEAPVFGGS